MMAITSTPLSRAGALRGAAALGWLRALAGYAAPAVALAAGLAAEWLDFRALRVPLLTMVGVGVVLTAAAATGGLPAARAFASAVAVGAATWAAAEAVYCVVHVATGQRFHAERFGPQPLQALALVAAHGVFLGAPTGAVAGSVLLAWRRVRKLA